MSDWVGGALVSEVLKVLIAETKKSKDFKPLFEDLVSTMETLVPLMEQIDSIQGTLDFGFGELKELMTTIQRASDMVAKCRRGVPLFKRTIHTREIQRINKDMLKWCQLDLQILQYRRPLSLLRYLCSVPKLSKVPVGLDRPLIELKKGLIDNTMANLVVSSPPGCGKTTLVTHLCHDLEVKRKFKHILFNVVSSTPNFRVIVQDLLLHNGHAPLTFENDTQATVALRKLLEKLVKDGPILLVLDDVWKGADSFLEKFRVSIQNYKVLVTSRSEFQSFGSTYYLEPLEYENARALLVQWASRPDNASPDEYERLLNEILKRCNGFPLLIKVVGVSLNGRSLSTWKSLVSSWSEGTTILDSPRPSVLQSLQPSFVALESHLKECFMDMGSFLEDQKIRASVIIDMWMELYGIVSSVECMKYLEDLASQNLLKLVPLGNEHEDGFYDEYLVTQHGILRELAIHQSGLESFLERKKLNLEIREDQFPDWCLNQMEPIIINASLLSISTDDLFSSNWVEMECPNVEALILNISSPNFALPSFISGMSKLKVLITTNHGSYPARLTNFSCLSLLPNLKRIRLGNQVWSAPDMPFDTSGLPPYYDITAFSTDNSPIHSPQPRSPRRHILPMSPVLSPPRDSISSLLHPRLSTDVINGRSENSNVHPMPRPPGAACLSSSAACSVPCQQAPLEQDSFPMNSQWKKGKLIGRGNFGSVFVASNSETGALRVMKEVELFPDDRKSAECVKQLEQEIKLLSNLKHPNIVQYFGSERVDDRFFIIYLEYVHPGSINKYIQEHCGGTMTESVLCHFTRQILSGLAYLHSKKTVHR